MSFIGRVNYVYYRGSIRLIGVSGMSWNMQRVLGQLVIVILMNSVINCITAAHKLQALDLEHVIPPVTPSERRDPSAL